MHGRTHAWSHERHTQGSFVYVRCHAAGLSAMPISFFFHADLFFSAVERHRDGMADGEGRAEGKLWVRVPRVAPTTASRREIAQRTWRVCALWCGHLGACRRRAPRSCADLKVPKDASRQDLLRCYPPIRSSPRRSAVGMPRKYAKNRSMHHRRPPDPASLAQAPVGVRPSARPRASGKKNFALGRSVMPINTAHELCTSSGAALSRGMQLVSSTYFFLTTFRRMPTAGSNRKVASATSRRDASLGTFRSAQDLYRAISIQAITT